MLTRRNTPTHVGKTRLSMISRQRNTKHPHARGEDSGTATAIFQVPETPPRTWGRHVSFVNGDGGAGNTPTHVGKTSSKMMPIR